MNKVEIYSTPVCKYCNMAKDFFKSHNVNYTEYNVATDLEKRREMVVKTGQMGVPVIVIGEKVIIGFDEGEVAGALGIK
ncbi:MAG: glutaredoxin domain-containing protein [bacterium]|nr:glutaredoxin domain-containing protein [bacterium]